MFRADTAWLITGQPTARVIIRPRSGDYKAIIDKDQAVGLRRKLERRFRGNGLSRTSVAFSFQSLRVCPANIIVFRWSMAQIRFGESELSRSRKVSDLGFLNLSFDEIVEEIGWKDW